MSILVTAIIFMNTYMEQFFDGAFHNLFISDIKVNYDAFLILGFYPVFCHFKKRHEKLIQQVFWAQKSEFLLTHDFSKP